MPPLRHSCRDFEERCDECSRRVCSECEPDHMENCREGEYEDDYERDEDYYDDADY